MLQNIPKEKILEIVRQGPTFPVKISKQMGGGVDTMLIGAILSTLISTGEVKVSTLKIGGSPLYYLPEQESKLEDYIDHLNEKDRKTFKFLKEQKILQDETQNPLTRVSLRGIKDFAKSFEIPFQGRKVLFWRFYTESSDDAESLAKRIIKNVSDEVPVKEAELPRESKPEIVERKAEESIVAAIETHAEIQAVLEKRKEVRESEINAENSEHEKRQFHEHAGVKHEHHEVQHHEHHEKVSKSHNPKVHKEPKVPKVKVSYDFFELLRTHIASIGLDVLSKEKIKKTEYDLILKNHDNNEYIYCKAKDKSSVSEGDLAPAVIFAQSKKMPCLFISTGELTKKAELMMGNELKGLRFERIIINQA